MTSSPADSIVLSQISDRLLHIEDLLAQLEDRMFFGYKRPHMSLDEVVQYTGYTKNYLYRLVMTHQIPYYKRGNRLFFEHREIDKWILGQRVRTQDELDVEATTYCATNRQRSKTIKHK